LKRLEPARRGLGGAEAAQRLALILFCPAGLSELKGGDFKAFGGAV